MREQHRRRPRLRPHGTGWEDKVAHKHKTRIVAEEPEDDETDDVPVVDPAA